MSTAFRLSSARGARHQTISPAHPISSLRFAFLAYLALLIAANSEAKVVKIRSVKNPHSESHDLKPNQRFSFTLIPTPGVVKHGLEDTEIFLEWVPKDPLSVEKIALLASNKGPLPDIRTNDTLKRDLIPRDCNENRPCFDAENADEISFFARPGYAFLRTPLSNKTNVLLYRHGGKGLVSGKFNIWPRRKKKNVPWRCGGRNEKMCGGKEYGKCEESGCSCNEVRTGRFCEDSLNAWTGCPKKKKSLFFGTTLQANTWHFWRYTEDKNCPPLEGREFILKYNPSKSVHVSVVAKSLDETCTTLVDTRGLPPSRPDMDKCGLISEKKEPGRIIDNKREGYNTKVFGFYVTETTRIDAWFKVCENRECRPDGRPFHGIHFLILPICLCILCVAAAIVCVLLYVDRRHGIVTGPDKLTETELGAMCPAYTLETVQGPDHAEHKTCSICISEFQVGDTLRRLKCDHRFHAGCIDPWLTQSNASCPTCREEARIPELSERRIQRAIVKHVLAPMLRLPLRARRRRMSSRIPALWRSNVENSDSNGESSSDEPGIPYCADEARASYTENTRPTPPLEPTPRQSGEIVLPITSEQSPSMETTTWESEDVILPNYSSPAEKNDGSEIEVNMPSYSPPTPPQEPTAEEMAEDDAANAGTFPDRIRGSIFEKEQPSSSSFYTETLNFDMTELHARGVLPHVRENLQAPANEPIVPESMQEARERRDGDK